jgi:ribosomal protein L29
MTKKRDLINKQIATKTVKELKTQLREMRLEWLKLKMELKVNKAKDVHAARKKRKEIAFIQTIIGEKTLKELSK